MPIATGARQNSASPSMTLLNLPSEILGSIFEFLFQCFAVGNGDPSRGHGNAGDEKLLEKQKLRLVCRRFNDVASAFLIPIVTISLNQESLDRLTAISHHALIASGVREIHVDLRYRLAEVAGDIQLFKNLCKRLMNQMSSTLNYYSEACFFRGTSHQAATAEAKRYRLLMDRESDCYRFISAWDSSDTHPSDIGAEETEELKQDPDNSDEGWDFSVSEGETDENYYVSKSSVSGEEARQLLHDAHTQYKQIHYQQLQVIIDGSFGSTVASAMARMQSCVDLKLTDFPDRKTSDLNVLDPDQVMEALSDREHLLKHLVRPSQWEEMEDLAVNQGAVLAPVGILSALPIALHEAGVALRKLTIRCFPLRSNFALLSPDCSSLADSAHWDTFRSACANLKSFYFFPSHNYWSSRQRVRDEHISGAAKACIDAYLNAAISSPRLEELHINMSPLGFNEGSRGSYHGWYTATPLFEKVRWPRMKELHVSYMKSDEATLLSMLENLGPRLRRVFLSHIDLVEGNWFATTQVLKEKLSAGNLAENHKKSVKFCMPLHGGELGYRTGTDDEPVGRRQRKRNNASLETVLSELESYIMGTNITQNPLLRRV
ncbi:hypothetical protein S40293_07887 [Stachybotrys chartarum IBT 40293]|nr:hypothetical protein S40293_07887 [Stachybotrys chartarum IBT 40293]